MCPNINLLDILLDKSIKPHQAAGQTLCLLTFVCVVYAV